MEYWTEGSRAFAFWDADEYFYPATIVAIEDADIFIRFDSGEEEWTDADYLEEFMVQAGDQVECRAADDIYYNVTVLGTDGERVEVEFDNETTEWTTLSRLRFFVDEA